MDMRSKGRRGTAAQRHQVTETGRRTMQQRDNALTKGCKSFRLKFPGIQIADDAVKHFTTGVDPPQN